jgi:hypothetical protein
MTDAEIDAIIASAWQEKASLAANLRSLVRVAACYGWRCAKVGDWLTKHRTH